MTASFEKMLRLFALSACTGDADGYPDDFIPDINEIKTVLTLADEQTVGRNVRAALLLLSAAGRAPAVTENDRVVWKALIKTDIFAKLKHEDGQTAVLKALKAKGIQAVTLKGTAAARFYKVPEYRLSVDTDIYVVHEDEESALCVFRSLGFQVAPRTLFSNHSSCRSPEYGEYELHTSFYADIIRNNVLCRENESDAVREPFDEYEVYGAKRLSLGPTDAVCYMFAHFAGHFVNSGASIRQICDILLHIRYERRRIDFQRFLTSLDRWGFRSLYDVICSLGIHYLSFSLDELPGCSAVSADVFDMFIYDLEEGGWIGKKRENSGEALRYFGLARAGDRKAYLKELKKYQKSRIAAAIFPPKERIAAKFSFIKKSALLLPVGWVCWLFYGLALMKKGELSCSAPDSAREADEVIRRRIMLFESLMMIKERAEHDSEN
ncbi:MAG: nucleotidyltransferase family protein [Oscillospiraceae bacterium]|nr:nucleotidyltransferase family protein [Oscillospiraceae bacterium]